MASMAAKAPEALEPSSSSALDATDGRSLSSGPSGSAIDDVATTSHMSHSSSTGSILADTSMSMSTSTSSVRSQTPSSLPATPGTPPSLASLSLRDRDRDLEIDTVPFDDDHSEADSASASGTVAPITSSAALRQKHHRHFARSAAKRESVASLPSIQNLRNHFLSGAKTEFRAGHGAGIRSGNGGLGVMPEDADEGGRSSSSSSGIGLGRPRHQPWKDVQLFRVAPAAARAEAAELANGVRKRWGVDRGVPDSATPPPGTSVDIRSIFVETARTVRRVRTLGLSLNPRSASTRRVSGPPKKALVLSTPSRPAQPVPRVASGPAGSLALSPPDPVHRAALDLLSNLRTLEERLRVKHDAPTVVVIPDAANDLVASPVDDTTNFSFPDRPSSASPPPDLRCLSPSSHRPSTVSSLEDSLFSEDEDWSINDVAREEELRARPRPHEVWEDRLLSEDRSYRALEDGEWAELTTAVRDAARRWADAVDCVFGQYHNGGPIVSWISSGGTEMERAREFLAAHLEPEHAALLPATEDALLTRLADGYLLVQAYNAAVHSSHRPWGFIPEDDVHDTVRNASSASPPPGEDGETEASTKLKEWTFRRVANLTAWAAAVRLRYNLPIVLPHSAVLAPPTLPDGKPIPRAVSVSVPKKKDAPRIDFDPLLVAKREPEGESMLRTVLLAWLAAAAREAEGSDRGDEKNEKDDKEKEQTEDKESDDKEAYDKE